MTRAVVGVLAIQGDFEAHARALEQLGADAREVRTAGELEPLDALVIPGGESTAITLGMERDGLAGPVRDFALSGKRVLGTCAGLILLDREHLGVLDLTTRRNAFGRQRHSFEADLELRGIGRVRGVFIRAPWVEQLGPGAEAIGELEGHPVAVRAGNVLAVAFHPELTEDRALHRWVANTNGGMPE